MVGLTGEQGFCGEGKMAVAGNGGEGAAGAADRRIEDGLRREMLDADERARLKSTKPLGTRKPII